MRRALTVLLLVLALPPAASAAPGAVAVTAGAEVVSGPDTGSTTRARAGDTARWAIGLDPLASPQPSVAGTFSIAGAHRLVPGSVQAPPGFAVAYSDDGTAYGPTGTTAARRVRVSGPLPEGAAGSLDPLNGPTAPSIPGSSGGDGYAPVLTSDRVFNVFHHIGLRVDCHVLATGALCPGYPYDLTVGGAAPVTGNAPIAVVDEATGRLHVAAQRADAGSTLEVGVACLDVGALGDAPSSCGWTATGTVATTGNNLHGGAQRGDRLFAIATDGDVHCAELTSHTACPGYPRDLGLPAADAPHMTALTPVGDRPELIARTSRSGLGGTLACLDTATDAPCAGWGGTRTIPTTNDLGAPAAWDVHGDVVPIQATGTGWDAFCGVRHSGSSITETTFTTTCWRVADGTTLPAPAALTHVPQGETGWIFGMSGTGRADVAGDRVVLTATKNFSGGDRVACLDFAAGGTACSGFPHDVPGTPLRAYATTLDPSGTCIWVLGDAGRFDAFDVADPTQGCATSTTTVTVQPAVAYCGADRSGPAWGEVAVRGVAAGAGFSSGAITVRGTDGVVVPGFDRVALPPSGRLDLSGVPKSGPTAGLVITAGFGDIDVTLFSGTAQLQTTWAGPGPQVCFDTQPVASCSPDQDLQVGASAVVTATPGGAGPAGTAAAQLVRLDPEPAGCADADVAVEACTSGSLAACALGATGVWGTTATVAAGQTTTFRVTVTNAGTAPLTGLAVTPQGLPGCGRTIASLAPGASTSWTCSATAVAPGVGERPTVTATATCPTGPCRTTTAQAPATAQVTTPPPPQAQTTEASRTSAVVAIPPGGGVTLLTAGGTPTSVVHTPQGTYVLDPASGTIVFSPADDADGPPPAVRFRVTDGVGATAEGTWAPDAGDGDEPDDGGDGPAPAGAAPGATPPGGAATTAPRPGACTSRRTMTINWKVPKGARLRWVKVLVAGRPVVRLKGTARRHTVSMKGLPPTTFKVTFRALTWDGRVLGASRTYRTCRSRLEHPPLPTLKLLAKRKRPPAAAPRG